ncbi:unnamed protein product [Vitrella brassicaformis CCMP3155]|uniref:Tyrosine-protein kinase ephrin type A/B receptor-like domain-containing protein n=1 Tax=Vitrella brassicaformis (strain CCMP3155) TaxID=1169540 RepID=A0A0G4H242_VITBC|nr:unnamed protein product [Vitrella brassicaformis CCMP3155]|eukprot:CEM37692.1 unnamed protein product [Vitrella brassicaformis CCMP3155]
MCQKNCEIGYERDKDTCRKWPAGQYGKIENGKATCEQCGADLISPEGSTDKELCYCTNGFIKHSSKLRCEKCIEDMQGLDCEQPIKNRSLVPTKKGFYLLTYDDRMTTYAAKNTTLPVVIPCPFKQACDGVDEDTGLTKCLSEKGSKYRGFVCGLCEKEYARRGPTQPCHPCGEVHWNILFAFLLIIASLVAIFGLAWLAERAGTRPRDDVIPALFKLGLNHLTSISVLAMLVLSISYDVKHLSKVIVPTSRLFTWDGGMPFAYGSWECIIDRWGRHDNAVLWRHAAWVAVPLVCLIVIPAIGAIFL